LTCGYATELPNLYELFARFEQAPRAAKEQPSRGASVLLSALLAGGAWSKVRRGTDLGGILYAANRTMAAADRA
jgi:hypothetical protein